MTDRLHQQERARRLQNQQMNQTIRDAARGKQRTIENDSPIPPENRTINEIIRAVAGYRDLGEWTSEVDKQHKLPSGSAGSGRSSADHIPAVRRECMWFSNFLRELAWLKIINRR